MVSAQAPHFSLALVLALVLAVAPLVVIPQRSGGIRCFLPPAPSSLFEAANPESPKTQNSPGRTLFLPHPDNRQLTTNTLYRAPAGRNTIGTFSSGSKLLSLSVHSRNPEIWAIGTEAFTTSSFK